MTRSAGPPRGAIFPSRDSISTIAPGIRAHFRRSTSSPKTALEKSTPANPASCAAAARAAVARDLAEDREVRRLRTLGRIQIDEVQLLGAIRDVARGDVARIAVRTHTAAVRETSAANVDRRDDHHGRRFTSAA